MEDYEYGSQGTCRDSVGAGSDLGSMFKLKARNVEHDIGRAQTLALPQTNMEAHAAPFDKGH